MSGVLPAPCKYSLGCVKVIGPERRRCTRGTVWAAPGTAIMLRSHVPIGSAAGLGSVMESRKAVLSCVGRLPVLRIVLARYLCVQGSVLTRC